MTDRITIERETLQSAIELLESIEQPPGAVPDFDDVTIALRAALAAQPADAQQEPFGWLYDITNGDLTKGPIWQGGKDRSIVETVAADVGAEVFPVYAAPPPAAVPPGMALVPIEPTRAMVEAYLSANSAYWERIDAMPTKIGVWRNGTPKEATEVSYRAMIAAAGAAGERHE